MASKMTEVAKLLGVEFDKEFCTTESYVKYKLTKSGLQSYDKMRDWWNDASYTLTKILAGYIDVELSPWEPKVDEVYYIPRPDAMGRFVVARWQGSEVDVYRHNQGLVCKSAREAVDVAKKMIIALQEANDHFRLRHGLVFRTAAEAKVLTKKMLQLAEKTLTQEAKENG